MISIIVPVYNEEKALPTLLPLLDSLEGEYEVLFSDGGSTDNTLPLLTGRRVVTGAKGRGAQCNRAAEAARGDVLFFLHGDSSISADVLSHIQAALNRGASWGCLTLQFDDPALVYWFGRHIASLRVRLGHIAFGDQGIFVTRALYWKMGGFPNLPIMEDYEFSLRLKRVHITPVLLESKIITSARRFREGGPLRVGWRMQKLKAMYRRGVDLDTILQAYRDVREQNG